MYSSYILRQKHCHDKMTRVKSCSLHHFAVQARTTGFNIISLLRTGVTSPDSTYVAMKGLDATPSLTARHLKLIFAVSTSARCCLNLHQLARNAHRPSGVVSIRIRCPHAAPAIVAMLPSSRPAFPAKRRPC